MQKTDGIQFPVKFLVSLFNTQLGVYFKLFLQQNCMFTSKSGNDYTNNKVFYKQLLVNTTSET